ncbi:MAG: SHOCT domain-containing protein [Humidesulfovibrio sp.]|uniref:SHOCT domain-containing protein n=1 Tax=Humidesulfovibrio sp. TaxID=2910988 RepID=UPI0027F24E83|nr:SHOCT domain-containing protein [Humidesulfovibrio sp.]MDQ7835860.1 SHOCT domain-containing protein [Humidesulfovibrio sp.]
MSFLNISTQAALPSKWDGWPFNSGYGGDWQTTLATYAFSALILGAICVFLRLLFGPKGIWRDKELEREAEEAKRKELSQLEASLRSGRITQIEYKRQKRIIEQ